MLVRNFFFFFFFWCNRGKKNRGSPFIGTYLDFADSCHYQPQTPGVHIHRMHSTEEHYQGQEAIIIEMVSVSPLLLRTIGGVKWDVHCTPVMSNVGKRADPSIVSECNPCQQPQQQLT